MAVAHLVAAEQLEQQLDQVLALIPMAKEAEVLEQIATSLDIDLQPLAGNKRALQRKLITHLNSEDFDGHAERERMIISARDKLREHLGFEPEENPLEREDRVPVKKDESDSEASDPAESGDDKSEGEKEKEVKTDPRRHTTNTMALWPAGARLKDFKFSGQIGDKGEKGKLTYTGVIHQIETGLQLGFDEKEICSAVIRAITPGNTVRTYLEGKRGLTLKKLKSTLKAHFCEKDVTSVYNEMTAAVQGNGEKDTPLTFVVHMFALRDRILELSREKRSHRQRYSKKLVQAEMQKSIYAGLKDESIRQDLKQVLRQKDLDDDELMEELTAAMICKEEHDKKLQEASSKKKVAAHASAVMADESDSSHQTESKGLNSKARKQKTTQGNQNDRNNRNNNREMPQNVDPFMAQLSNIISTQIRDAVVPLQAQINELVGCQLDQKEGKPSIPSIPPLTPTAPVFNPQPKTGGGAVIGGGKAQGSNNGNDSTSGQKGSTTNSGNGNWQETLCNILDNLNMQGNSSNRGRGGRHPRFNNGNSLKKCSICQAANAVSCNHCLICHSVEHRTFNCPKRLDPNYVPKN